MKNMHKPKSKKKEGIESIYTKKQTAKAVELSQGARREKRGRKEEVRLTSGEAPAGGVVSRGHGDNRRD